MRPRQAEKDQPERRGLVNVEAAARILGVEISTVYAWVEQVRVPHVRLGRALRFDPEALRRWIEQHSVQADEQ